jgi:hypothetical protein
VGERYADALAASQSFAAQGTLPIHAFDQTETLLGIQERIRKLMLIGYNECKRATWSAYGQKRRDTNVRCQGETAMGFTRPIASRVTAPGGDAARSQPALRCQTCLQLLGAQEPSEVMMRLRHAIQGTVVSQ